MIILRTKNFSKNNMLGNIVAKLDRDGIEDYDVSSRIPKDSISITTDLANLKIYLPLDYEYSQYDIDDWVRNKVGSWIRSTTRMDRDLYVMTFSGKLNETQYYSLVKFIIESNEFVVLLDN